MKLGVSGKYLRCKSRPLHILCYYFNTLSIQSLPFFATYYTYKGKRAECCDCGCYHINSSLSFSIKYNPILISVKTDTQPNV
jgi:hypothetical protein